MRLLKSMVRVLVVLVVVAAPFVYFVGTGAGWLVLVGTGMVRASILIYCVYCQWVNLQCKQRDANHKSP